MAYQIKDVQSVSKKSKGHTVEYLGYRDVYRVKSNSSGRFYVVQYDKKKCTCKRQEFISTRNGSVNACSHVQAVERFVNSDYQLVARQAGTDTKNLHRKVFRGLEADGVVMTGRKA